MPESSTSSSASKGKARASEEDYEGLLDGQSEAEAEEVDLVEEDVLVEGEDQVTVYVWGLVLCASISGLMFGEQRF